MKVLVPVKHVLDYNLRPLVKRDGTGVDLSNVKLSMNPFDERAVEEAVRLKEAGKATEVVAVSIGSVKAQDTLRMALAMGADRAILVEADKALEPLAVARILKEIANEEGPGLVILGKQSIDNDASQTGQMLAAMMDVPQATNASNVEISGTVATVTQEVDGGLGVVALTLPAVVTTDLRLNAPRHPSMPNIVKARSKPLTVRKASDFGVDLEPRLDVIRVAEPVVRTGGFKVSSVDELVAKLKEMGVAQ
jgi:electron transfer flavoprotein beta subunit